MTAGLAKGTTAVANAAVGVAPAGNRDGTAAQALLLSVAAVRQKAQLP